MVEVNGSQLRVPLPLPFSLQDMMGNFWKPD